MRERDHSKPGVLTLIKKNRKVRATETRTAVLSVREQPLEVNFFLLTLQPVFIKKVYGVFPFVCLK